MSFCVITGRARSLPKPNFFPIIPPISPADARRLCRITGKRMDSHNYLPLLEVGKRPECVKCAITGKKQQLSDQASASDNKKLHHVIRNDFKYVTPILRKDVVEKGDAKAFEDLQKVLKRLKKGMSSEDERERMFVYMLPSLLCGLIVPAEVEEAIRLGEMESVSLSKTCDKAVFKIRGKPTLFIPLKEVDIKATANTDTLLDGLGQSKETLAKQKKVLEEKKRRILVNKKIFEDLERQADEELQKDLDRPKGEARIFGGAKSKEAKEYRQKLAQFRQIYLPSGNMAVYGPNWNNCLQKLEESGNIETNLDWSTIEQVRAVDLDTPLPSKNSLIGIDEDGKSNNCPLDGNKLMEIKRRRNVYIPDGAGLEIVPHLESGSINEIGKDIKISAGLEDLIHNLPQEQDLKRDEFNGCWSLKSMFAVGNEEAIKILPTLEEFISAMTADPEKGLFVRKGCIYDNGDGPKFCDNPSAAPKDSNVIIGAIFKVLPRNSDKKSNKPDLMRFFPGQFLADGNFVPGQRMASVKGEFIPAACIKSIHGFFQHIPGIVTAGDFSAGQFLRDGNQATFVKGQVVHTKFGSKYVDGETINTADGIKFVAGVTLNEKFVGGAIIDEGGDKSRFVCGQMISELNGEDALFIPGEMGLVDSRETFVPGQRVENGIFRPGQMISGIFCHGEIIFTSKGQPQFLPGIYKEEKEDKFCPGLVVSGSGNSKKEGSLFIEGKLLMTKDKDTLFVPGTTHYNDEIIRFEKCKNPSGLSKMKSPSPPPMALETEGLALIHKKIKPKNGTMVVWENGSQFYVEGSDIPQNLTDCNNAEFISGRMECTENGPLFVAGKVMEIHGIRTFIPGKMIMDEETQQLVFVPGKMVFDGKNGPRFWPGQVIESEDGDERFIPGQIMDSVEDGIKRFVPGQIIETKSGPVFIPGQVLRTDNGLKFVPGVIVETSNGSAVFVPAQVLDSPEGARLLKGHVVDTEDGPRLLPPDIKGDDGMDLNYIVQGFDIDQMEARLILGGNNDEDSSEFSDVLDGIGGASIGAEALKALAEGFDTRRGNVINTIGEGQGQDVDTLLQDEMLDSCDSPSVRTALRGSFLAIFTELCQKIDEITAQLNSYINDILMRRLDTSLMMPSMKLNPALESLKQFFQTKISVKDPAEYEILNLIAGIITYSIPGALKECCSGGDPSRFDGAKFNSILLSCIEDSIKGILEEDGILSNGVWNDIQELVKLAQELDFDENKSFLAKVEAVTEGRCNSKFMDTLLRSLQSGSGDGSSFTGNELLTRLINILAPRLELQSGFKELSHDNPDFVQDVLDCLKSKDPREVHGFNAIDLLHHAITKVINNKCQRKIDDVVHKVELDGMVLEKDQDIRSMLEQAIGLAKYMGKSGVVDSLFELLGDPIRLEAIRDDPVIKDVLNKILVMQNLTAKDTRKRQKLEKLQRYQNNEDEDEEDSSLRELIKICDALTRPPHQGNLRKSKSMVKKSKSMIITAKDIPMNAFMAMKNTAHEKDTKWLQNFLSKSIVEEIPWECSKALIILKEGYQAIIPREASRSILLGEASYTLIDDSGVEFYLSPKDKLNRKKQGLDDSVKKVKICPDLDTDTELEEAEEADAKEQKIDKEKTNDQNKKIRLQDIVQRDSPIDKFTTNEDYTPYRASRGQARRKNYDFSDDDEDDEGTMKSLEKYRPSFYEAGPPKESGDINDIRDYYTNMLTRQRAMNRFTGYQPQYSGNDYDNHVGGEPAFENQRSGHRNGNSASYGEYESYLMDDQGFPPNLQASRFQPAMDQSTKYLLDKAKAARSRPVWEPEDQRHPFEEETMEQPLARPKEVTTRAPPQETMMSSRTRSLLDQVKQSTAALQTMSTWEDEVEDRTSSRRPSRFLRRSEDQLRNHRGYNDDSSFDVSRMADEILGESMYPNTRDNGGATGRFSSGIGNAAQPPPPRRKHSYQSSLDTDRFSDRSSPDSRVPTGSRAQQRIRKDDEDDDDLDAMINSLKQKTSGRDMSKVVYDIEGDANGRTYGRKSISPIPKRDYSYDPTPLPDARPRPQQSRQGPTTSYDPYNHLRGGSGYAEQGYTQSQFGYRQQPQPPPMDPYGYPPNMGYAYGPRQPHMQPQTMYQGYYPASNPSATGRRPSTYGYYD